ncbi:hypothetical protein QVD99_004392 [Batrachochytrium dendrobatidis]|nr:hypothetical protein QVD99_004392 [Batrachochytrium dendrobatidis]
MIETPKDHSIEADAQSVAKDAFKTEPSTLSSQNTAVNVSKSISDESASVSSELPFKTTPVHTIPPVADEVPAIFGRKTKKHKVQQTKAKFSPKLHNSQKPSSVSTAGHSENDSSGQSSSKKSVPIASSHSKDDLENSETQVTPPAICNYAHLCEALDKVKGLDTAQFDVSLIPAVLEGLGADKFSCNPDAFFDHAIESVSVAAEMLCAGLQAKIVHLRKIESGATIDSPVSFSKSSRKKKKGKAASTSLYRHPSSADAELMTVLTLPMADILNVAENSESACWTSHDWRSHVPAIQGALQRVSMTLLSVQRQIFGGMNIPSRALRPVVDFTLYPALCDADGVNEPLVHELNGCILGNVYIDVSQNVRLDMLSMGYATLVSSAAAATLVIKTGNPDDAVTNQIAGLESFVSTLSANATFDAKPTIDLAEYNISEAVASFQNFCRTQPGSDPTTQKCATDPVPSDKLLVQSHTHQEPVHLVNHDTHYKSEPVDLINEITDDSGDSDADAEYLDSPLFNPQLIQHFRNLTMEPLLHAVRSLVHQGEAIADQFDDQWYEDVADSNDLDRSLLHSRHGHAKRLLNRGKLPLRDPAHRTRNVSGIKAHECRRCAAVEARLPYRLQYHGRTTSNSRHRFDDDASLAHGGSRRKSHRSNAYSGQVVFERSGVAPPGFDAAWSELFGEGVENIPLEDLSIKQQQLILRAIANQFPDPKELVAALLSQSQIPAMQTMEEQALLEEYVAHLILSGDVLVQPTQVESGDCNSAKNKTAQSSHELDDANTEDHYQYRLQQQPYHIDMLPVDVYSSLPIADRIYQLEYDLEIARREEMHLETQFISIVSKNMVYRTELCDVLGYKSIDEFPKVFHDIDVYSNQVGNKVDHEVGAIEDDLDSSWEDC